MSEADTVSPADVAGLNQAVVARGANLARQIGTGLLVIAGLGAAAWAWLVLRSLDLIGERDRAGLGDDPGAVEQIDLVAALLPYLVYSSLAAGVGVALRLGADYMVARTGGSLTGVRPGEPLASVRRWPPDEADGNGGEAEA